MHEVWHITILTTTLFAAAGAVILLLAPLIFESPPAGLVKYRPLLLGAIATAVVLGILEWTVVH